MSEPITPGEDGGSASMAERTTAVTAIELLLDLVFVAAIGQLASTLHDDVSWRGGVETVVLWVPLYLLWAHTTFSATGTITENKSARRPILCVLFFGIFMAAGIPVAFEDGSGCLAFVAPYLIAQLGQVALTWSIHGRAEMNVRSRNVMVWHSVSAIGWIIGVFVEPGIRLWVWLEAVIVEVMGMLLRHPLGHNNDIDTTEWQFDTAHMLERIRLFLILALGEQIVSIVTGLHQAGFHLLNLAAAVASIVTFFALWWLYIWDIEVILETDPQEHDNPAESGATSITVQLVLALGLIPLAVSDEIVIDEPTHSGSLILAALACGGAILYLAAQAWQAHKVTGHASWRRLGAILALIAVGTVTSLIPAIVTNALVAAILVVTAVMSRRHHIKHFNQDPTQHDRIIEK